MSLEASANILLQGTLLMRWQTYERVYGDSVQNMVT
jgi:hypothetical protein